MILAIMIATCDIKTLRPVTRRNVDADNLHPTIYVEPVPSCAHAHNWDVDCL